MKQSILIIILGAGLFQHSLCASLPDSYPEAFKCGPNSLLMLLILVGHPEVTMEKLNQILTDVDGSSLIALRNAARQFNVETQIRRYPVDNIDSLPLPAIIQYKQGLSTFVPHHFIVVYKVDRDRYYFIDGTTGWRLSGRKSTLPQFWTGYALTEKRLPGGVVFTHWRLILGSMLALALEGIVFLLYRSFARGSWPLKKGVAL